MRRLFMIDGINTKTMEQKSIQPVSPADHDGSNEAIDSPLPQSPATSEHIDLVTGNNDRSETILLIHGACASSADWDLVVPHLSSYHLLLPSLFTTSSLNIVRNTRQSKALTSQRWDSCYAFHLAELVKTYAKNGRAHIVGLSFGGCLAVKLLAAYPKICLSVFVSGLPSMVSTSFYPVVKPLGTALMWTSHYLTRIIGAKNMGKFLDGEVEICPGFWDGKGGGGTVEMNGILTETVMYSGHGEYHVEKIKQHGLPLDNSSSSQRVRVRLVAASRKNQWTPVADSPEWAIQIAKTLLGEKSVLSPADEHLVKGIDCRVYEGKRMFHPWCRQLPELFAQCILSTAQGEGFPTDGLDEVWRNELDGA